MKDMGPINYCLGIEFKCTKTKIQMCQKKYIEDLLEKYKMTNCRTVTTPVEVGLKLDKRPSDAEEPQVPYRSLIGSLMYLAVATRPDIAFAVNSLSQFNESYGTEHWKAAKRVLRYLNGTLEYGLVFKKTEEPIQGFCDADWGNCGTDRRSYSGYFFRFGGAAITWEARKQRTVALSSVEAEYMALAEAAREATYLKNFLRNIGYQTDSINVKCDSQGAKMLAENPVHHARSKHIDIKHHFVRQALEDGVLNISYLPTSEMPADVLTKGLPREKHNFCRDGLGVF
ncbi:Hydra magnipapillata [Nesidiocoris tenuis]|uniref:Hydra magnipapillata n=1 Tax=Nesidiocoris tenuis TaxID=355587 RepID=A0ABN7B5R0_9HEMI|nr:Hydra magnipapillata [Nesidiocoris tenuis]